MVSGRVLLVDDEPTYLSLVRQLLSACPGLRVVGEASSGEQALAAATGLCPEVAIVDVQMPGMDGFQTARALLGLLPDVRIVIVSASPEEGYEEASRRAGAVGFLSKKHISARALETLLVASAEECAGAQAGAPRFG